MLLYSDRLLQGCDMKMKKIDCFQIEGKFPAFITAQENLSLEQFLQKIRDNKAALQTLLLEHGGLVFRGFPVDRAQNFANVIKALDLGQFVNYIGGDSPRDKVENEVYTSTEAPPSFHIPLHQELSFMKHFPRHIYFYCDIEPQVGGSTIIGDARAIYHAIDPELRARFEQKGLSYKSHYYYRSKIMSLVNRWQRSHKSWTEAFETNDKAELEKKCHESGFQFRWLPRDWVEVKQNGPTTIKHPITQEPVWFNQVQLYDFNPRLLGWKRYLGAKLFYFRKSTILHEINFADGSTIPRKDIYHIFDTLDKHTVAFPWRKGDVMVLDNVLAMHGRAPFSGKRRILTALTI